MLVQRKKMFDQYSTYSKYQAKKHLKHFQTGKWQVNDSAI